MKASFSLSSLRCASPIPSSLGENQEHDHQLRHLSLPRSKRRDHWQRSWENKDEFWEALQTNYNYLMNEELITSCKAANGELDEKESCLVWPYQDFLREYNELIQWLRKLECDFQKAKSENSVESLDGLEQQMINNGGRRKNFNEQAHRLKDRYPDVKGEIHDKISELNNYWDTLSHNIFPRKPREETIAIIGEIECQLRCLRKWLRDMENRLHLSCIQPGLAMEDIQEMMIQQQALQKEIEACNGFAAVAKLLGRLRGYFAPEPEVGAGCGGDSPERTRHAHLDRVGRNLERHWHDLWLRSLEKQCALEQLLGSQGLDCSCTSLNSSGCDEPLTKFPRLGGSARRLAKEVVEEEKRRRQEDHDDEEEDHEEKILLTGFSPQEHREETKKAKRGRKESKDAATEYGPGPAVSSKGVMVRQRSMALPESLAVGRMEPVDVGYSSESSTHLSNDEGVVRGESVRVYTYPTPDNTKPHILDEVVLDDGYSRRKQNALEDGDDDDEDDTLRESFGVCVQGAANCGTFDFKHVDTDQSDMEGQHKAEAKKSSVVRRLALDDANSDRIDNSEQESEWAPSLIFSEEDFEEGWEYGYEEFPVVNQVIQNLVDAAEHLVRRSSKNGSNPVSVYNSSCDASCESTSSDADGDDAEDHVADCSCAEKVDAFVEPTSEQPQPVVLRANSSGKKRGADRPWSVVESYRRSREYTEGVQQTIMSASEGALDLIALNGAGIETGNLEDWPSTSTKTSQSSVRRRRRRRSRLLTDSQCGSDSTSISATTAVGLGSDQTASPRRRRYSQTASSNNTSRSHSHSRSAATDADSCCPPPNGEPEPGETTAATDGHISSHSEQASWDDYQEGLYPSEHYSEQELDAAAVYRLMNFGDDYRAILDCQSDGNSTPCCCMPMAPLNWNRPEHGHLLAQHSRQHHHHHQHDAAASAAFFGGKPQGALRNALDSDSDADDLYHVMKSTARNLREIKNFLHLHGNDDFSSPANRIHYNEVLATCKTNLGCLQSVLNGLGERQEGSTVVNSIKDYMHDWQKMTKEAEQQQQYRQCLEGFQKELACLNCEIRAVGCKVGGNLQSKHQLHSDIATLECNLKALEEKNKTLIALNAEVNSFVNETGKDVNHLKKEVGNCYDLWHGSHSKIRNKIEELQRLQELWVKLEKELEQLKAVLERDENAMKAMADILNRSAKRSKVDRRLWQQIATAKDFADIVAMLRASEGGITLSGFLVDSAGYEQSFANAKTHLCEMRELFGVDGQATFAYFEERVRNVDMYATKQKLMKESLQLQVASLLEKSESLTKEKPRGVGGKGVNGEKPRRSRLWRILRAALPIQLAVVLLLCIACLLEPRCCDSVNNLNLSLTPQLRYVRGPPPI